MAIGTTIGLMLGTYGAIDSFIGGNTMRKQALKGLEEFEAQELTNAYANLHPSLQAEQNALNTISETESGMFDAAQGYNAADALAIISSGSESNNKARMGMYDTMRKEMANYDTLRAGDEVALRSMQEQREMNEVNSLTAQLAAGEQQRMNALMGGAKMFLGVGLAAEDREAGLGIDPKAARRQRIADNAAERGVSGRNLASFGDYMREGDIRGYRENQRLLADDRANIRQRLQLMEEGMNRSVENARMQINNQVYNPDGSMRNPYNNQINGFLQNPDGSMRFPSLNVDMTPFTGYGFGSIQPITF